MLDSLARMKSARKSTCHDKLGTMKNIHRWGFLFIAIGNCPLDVWRFSTTRHYHICHRSGRLGYRVGYTLDFKPFALAR